MAVILELMHQCLDFFEARLIRRKNIDASFELSWVAVLFYSSRFERTKQQVYGTSSSHEIHQDA